MRLAIVAASCYEDNGQVAPIPNAELDVELFGGRLAEADAGFLVHAFSAQRGLAEGVEELIASLGERPSALIFYFWGYALVSEERGPTLLLDGPKLSSFTLARLRRQLTELADVALVVLDTTLAEGSFGTPISAVRAMGSALSSGDSNISSLIAVRSPEPAVSQGPPPFTGLLQMILDAQTGSALPLTPESLFRAMQCEDVMFADIPAAGCFLGRSDFVLVSGVEPLGISPAVTAYEDNDEVTAPRAPSSLPASAPEPARVLPPPPPPPLPRPAARVPMRAQATPEPSPVAPRPAAPSLVDAASLVQPSTEAELYRRLLRDFERAQDRDAAYRAAVCLEVLAEADINESLLVTTHRPEGLQAVRGALSYADWHERLCAGCDEPRINAVLRAVGLALPRVGFQYARRLHRQPSLSDDARQDPEKSTTTLAKTLHWTSRLLCVPVSELFVLPEVEGALRLVPGPERPSMTCARSLGSGHSLPELVCLWARELAFARPEAAALCYFPGAPELSQLLLAALAVGGATPLRAIDAEAKRLASLLKREVRGAALDALRAAAQAIPAHEVGARAKSFIRSAELVARRVALVACGDLELVLALDTRFARSGMTSAQERRADLMRFNVSAELGQIRAELGVSLN